MDRLQFEDTSAVPRLRPGPISVHVKATSVGSGAQSFDCPFGQQDTLGIMKGAQQKKLLPHRDLSSSGSHLQTLLWKNWMLKRRHTAATLAEIFIPVLFVILTTALKALTSDINVPEGWSDDSKASEGKNMGTSYNLFDPQGSTLGSMSIMLFTAWIQAARFTMTELSFPGLLLYLGLRTAEEMRTVENNPFATKSCKETIAFTGAVGIQRVSPSSHLVPEMCRNSTKAIYKLAIVPDNNFTRNYFYPTLQKWYPRTAISKSDLSRVQSPVMIPSVEDSTIFFKTEADFESYITNNEYGRSWKTPKVYAAIVFDRYPEDNMIGKYTNIEYSIRMNATRGRRNSENSVPHTLGDPPFVSAFQRTLETTYYTQYTLFGFATLQTLVTRFLTCMPDWDAARESTTGKCQQASAMAIPLNSTDTKLFHSIENDLVIQNLLSLAFRGRAQAQLELSSLDASDRETILTPLRIAPQPLFKRSISPFAMQAYISSPFYDSVKGVFPLLFILSYLYAVSRILVVLIQEKETRSREYMKILGVQERAIFLSWYITYFLILFLGSLLQAIAAKLGVFANSEFVLLFLFFFFFSMTVLGFGYLISTLFSRSKTGSFTGIVLFFVMYFISSAFSSTSSTSAKTIACIFSPVALSFGIDQLASAEATGVGINFSNASALANNFRFSISVGFLLLDFFLYSIMGLYLDRVVPKEFGTTEKWYFPFSPAYWSNVIGNPKVLAESTVQSDELCLAPCDDIEPVSAGLHGQEISGEALVIANIKKEFAVPGGTKLAVKGINLAMYKDQITCLLGHNGAGKTTLISMLTGMVAPSEGDAHFRGLSLRKDISKIRQSLGLCFQHDVLYSDLSVEEHLLFYGRIKGYHGSELKEIVTHKIKEVGLTEKRKVFSTALSGGMKRKLSVAISLLGDSSLVFLDEPTSGMDPYSRRSTWETLLNNRQNRVIVLTTHFMDEADILGDRIAIMAEGALRCCGSSLFLKNRFGAGYNFTLVKFEHCDDRRLESFVIGHVPSARLLNNVGAEIAFQLPVESSNMFASMFEYLDDHLDELGVSSYGISVTTMEEVFIKVAEASDETNQHTLNKNGTPIQTSSDGVLVSSISKSNNALVVFSIHLEALLRKRLRIAKRDRRVVIYSALLPILLLLIGFVVLKTSSITRNDVKLAMSAEKFDDGANMPVPYYCSDSDTSEWCSLAMRTPNFLGGIPQKISSEEFRSPPYTSDRVNVFGVTYTPPLFNASGETGQCLRMGEFIYNRGFGNELTSVKSQFGGYLIQASSVDRTFGYHAVVNTTAAHAAPIYKASIDQALYRWFASSDNPENAVTLKVNSFPMPYSAATKSVLGSFLAFIACLFIVIAFAFFPTSIVGFLVHEKHSEHNCKHQQIISGVSLPAFWLSNYMWDFTCYLLPFLTAIIFIQIFDISALTGRNCMGCTDETYGSVVLIFFLFGLAICPFTYIISYFFKEASAAQTYTIMFNFILGLGLLIVSFILDVIDASQDTNNVLKYFYRLSPLYSLGNGLLNLCLHEIRVSMMIAESAESPYRLNLMGWELLYLGLTALLYFSIALGIDYISSYPKLRAAIFKDPQIQYVPYEEDEDVKREAMRVATGAADKDAVILRDIRKVYKGNKVAVRNVSLGLAKGECFGYLGINGAGKTTTMKMLTGDILPTSGTGSMGGFDILTQQLQVRQVIGYCPQFDALFELLSVREHLELFARIKGVTKSSLNQVVAALMHQMNLDDFEHKLAGTLSGGNKRKLSVAIAMIGSPPIIFLDEPSTGMDPVSRRFMWNVIAAISTQKKESTIVLTTHSMEECEALCSSVGIMVGGRLRCLGSVQHLKTRFGDGLMVELKLESPSAGDINDLAVTHLDASNNILSSSGITRDQLADACFRLGVREWAEKISATHPTGYTLCASLEREGSITVGMLCAWWITETRFANLEAYLHECFGSANVQLLERQNESCRYKLTADPEYPLKLSHVFRNIESGKQKLLVREYAVSQTTLEQIFNQFASQQDEEKGVARGVEQHVSL